MSLGIFDGLGAAPTKWWADERVKQLQTLLNPELKRLGCSTQLKVDGLIGPATCGAWKFVDDAVGITGVAPSAALIDLIKREGPDLAAGCKAVAPYTAPSCPTPKAPTAAPAPDPTGPSSGDILVMQSLLNDELLKPNGYQLVPETGKLDSLTCGTASAAYADIKAGRVKASAELSRLVANTAIASACGSYQPWVVAKRISAPEPAPAPAPSPAPAPAPIPAPTPTADYSQCWIEYQDKTPVVAELETLINQRLQAQGYKPITRTGTWNAYTCGAISVLKNKYSKWPTKACPGGVVVPLSCPKTILPAKVAVPKPAPPPPAPKPPAPSPTPRVSAVGVGLAALAATGAAFYAKKKGWLG